MMYISIYFNIYLSLGLYSVPEHCARHWAYRNETDMVATLKESNPLGDGRGKHRQITVDVKGTLQEVVCYGLKRKRSAHFRKP